MLTDLLGIRSEILVLFKLIARTLMDFKRGSFLFLNASERPSPIILSPWLRSSSDQCMVQVAVYKFYQQSGEYIARVLPIDESSSEILSAEHPEKHGNQE
ncbi:alk tyrosine kinase receptor [Limosa lapponica baueri]|uniref:Alk tyrosine kinase receptor n=1 Tax=Limosa lapponica baueri TaxID=1758121 RepID=A0A2I0U791_LIMLA|nr:alk tyrosine kinase receptor [Limosa lapponica baueri]